MFSVKDTFAALFNMRTLDFKSKSRWSLIEKQETGNPQIGLKSTNHSARMRPLNSVIFFVYEISATMIDDCEKRNLNFIRVHDLFTSGHGVR